MPRRGKRGWPGPPLGVLLAQASLHTPLPCRARRGRRALQGSQSFSDILFGHARKTDGQEYLVRSTVNHFGINKSVVDSVEIYDVLKGAKAKNVETDVIGSHTGTTPAARLLNASVPTELSVADLLEAVKESDEV